MVKKSCTVCWHVVEHKNRLICNSCMYQELIHLKRIEYLELLTQAQIHHKEKHKIK